jgi:hypothetical protein
MEGGEAAFAEYAEIVAGEMVGLACKVALVPGNTLSLFGHAGELTPLVSTLLCSCVFGVVCVRHSGDGWSVWSGLLALMRLCAPVFLNAVAMMLCSKVWNGDQTSIDTLKDLDLGEAEGLVVQLSGQSCTLTHKTVRPHPLW